MHRLPRTFPGALTSEVFIKKPSDLFPEIRLYLPEQGEPFLW
jgi:hypothetical protein